MRGFAVRVLGPFEVVAAGEPVRLTTGRLRTLIVVLAMSAGRAVSVDELASAVWGERLPANPRRSLQTYAGRLRAVLGDVRIDSTAAGFALRIDPENVDALRFVRLLDDAARQGDATAERARLADALRLWRGEPYDGVDSDWLREHQAPRLTERYLSAIERRIDLDVALGGRGDLAAESAELGALTARHPLRESLWARLLTVLGQAGRFAEALESYEAVRARIAADLGVDPSPELRRVHEELVAGRSPAARRDPRPTVIPRQLPARIERFAGRGDALAALDDLLAAAAHTPTAPVGVITGTAGVGKTTLAVRWANQVAGRFPDGQLHANLSGFGPGEAFAPAEVLRDFLAAFNVPPERVPLTVGAQASLFRSLLAGKRVLVLLDNARDADQVRPLLAGSPGCLTLVTSRNDLAGLIVTDGAHPVPLDVLSPADARQLLEDRLGPDRVAAERAAADAIVDACACLPLALAIVAARATLNPALPLAALAVELRDSRDDLTALDTGEEVTSVRAVFSWSHRAVPPEAARLYRLLGLHPAADVSVAAAASLAALPVSRTRTVLAQLQRTNLINERGSGRYRIHDLLRIHARELAVRQHDEADRHDATRRLVDHYLHSAFAADRLLDPRRDPIASGPPAGGVTVADLADQDRAVEWLRTERPVLLAIANLAVAHGFDIQVWQLAWALTTFLDRQGHWHDWAATQLAALGAAERLDDRGKVARAHGALARALTRLHDYDAARTHFTSAVEMFGAIGDPVGEAITHINLGWMYERREDFGHALIHNKQAFSLFEKCGHEVGQANVLNAIGWDHARLGDHRVALTYCERALELSRTLDHRFGQAEAWESLGYIHLQLGDHATSIACYGHALDLFSDLGAPALAATVLRGIGDACRRAGDTAAARTHYQRSLKTLEELNDPAADELRECLAQV